MPSVRAVEPSLVKRPALRLRTLTPKAVLEPARRTPAVRIVSPAKELAPVTVREPVPSLLRVPPVPVIVPARMVFVLARPRLRRPVAKSMTPVLTRASRRSVVPMRRVPVAATVTLAVLRRTPSLVAVASTPAVTVVVPV